ncbi:hypothetical protein ABEB36_006270 [Hypothenemus hampei]|uniref:Axonemal 84 kDa protein n=1 Tax=Hypothenemus hampei TaxID=57062 RepID=A0ABD1EQG1_HYPHA
MGKKGGKKGKIEKAIGNLEPNLSTIVEEDVPEKTGPEVKLEDSKVDQKLISENVQPIRKNRKKHKYKSVIIINDADRNLTNQELENKVNAEDEDPNIVDAVDGAEIKAEFQKSSEKVKELIAKEVRGKKKPNEAVKLKKAKKNKEIIKDEPETLEDQQSIKEEKLKSIDEKDETKKKKGKKNKKEKTKTQKIPNAEDISKLKSEHLLAEDISKQLLRSGSAIDQSKEHMTPSDKSAKVLRRKEKREKGLRITKSSSQLLNHNESGIGSFVARRIYSKTSDLSSILSAKIDDEMRPEERDQSKKVKGKKRKNKKVGTLTDGVKIEKTIEKKQRKEEEKTPKKATKKKTKLEKGIKPGELDYDELKKHIDELKKVAMELGTEMEKPVIGNKPKEGPKKKAGKKEKAKLSAEMVEKAKAEMEAQAKKLEELIKKKKEEDRLAAIDKDKRETLEQTQRVEQLQQTYNLKREIEEFIGRISKNEQQELEWEKYIECGKLPNPTMCDEMNTYLHLWELEMEKTSIQDASNRTADAIYLLNNLEELIETGPERYNASKLNNWIWIRQIFRNHQATSLDITTYGLLRDVEHNLNRINIPTADFNYKDDHLTLCLWLRVILPIPLPNPRRPPKPRVDIAFDLMDMTVLFPAVIDCENAAIRGMYLKYDHLSDLSESFYMPEVPMDFCMDLLSITKKEWHTKLKYKYDNRDEEKPSIKQVIEHSEEEAQNVATNNEENQLDKENPVERVEITLEEQSQKKVDKEETIPIVPFKQLKPTPSEFAMSLEDSLYNETRAKFQLEIPGHVINLRKYVILGGVFHLNLLAQPPQPQDFVTMEMTITALSLPKQLKVLPFKVVYTPYIPPEPTESSTSIRKLPEELEEELKKQEEELDKLIFINLKWPQHVIFLELPIVCRWDEETQLWSNKEIHDVKHNEDKCMISFRTGVFGIYGLATCKYSNLPFQAYDIKPEADESITVQLTAAILMMEFNIKDGMIAITQLQNSPNMTLQNTVGKYVKLHKLKTMMKEAGIDIFPAFDSFCYIDGCCEKHWPMERHLYFNMAQISNCFNFSWSRWNLQAGRRKIVMQMREYIPEKGKQKNHQMLLVTPLKATFIDCSDVSQVFSEKEMESIKFSADLYHLMKVTSGIFIRNKVSKAPKQNVHILTEFLISIRILSFS